MTRNYLIRKESGLKFSYVKALSFGFAGSARWWDDDGLQTFGQPGIHSRQRLGAKRLKSLLRFGFIIRMPGLAMKARLLWLSAWILTATCVWGLLAQWPAMWVLSPQALVLMFVCQWETAPDSLGAVCIQELAVGAAYYPVVAWMLTRAIPEGRARKVTTSLTVWHLVAIALAVMSAMVRNRLW
jgi:hypothetical protein